MTFERFWPLALLAIIPCLLWVKKRTVVDLSPKHLRLSIWIRAARNIKKGEELTYDYCTDGVGSIPCRCRPGCKVML